MHAANAFCFFTHLALAFFRAIFVAHASVHARDVGAKMVQWSLISVSSSRRLFEISAHAFQAAISAVARRARICPVRTIYYVQP